MCMLRKDASVLSLEPQPASEEMGMLRKSTFVLPLEPQPDSGEMGMLRKAIFMLPLKRQPDSVSPENSECPRPSIFEYRCTSLNPWHSHGLFLQNLTVLAYQRLNSDSE